MTEYDYSPDAWERYLHTQQRIAQWVDNTEAHRSEFGMDAHPVMDFTSPSGHRSTQSMLDVPHYRRRNSSSSASSDEEHFQSETRPSLETSQPRYQLYQHPVPNSGLGRPSPRRRSSTSHHYHHQHRTFHRKPIQTYVLPASPPNSPTQQYPYSFSVNTGPFILPGSYTLTTKDSSSYTSPVTTPYATPPPPPYYATQTGYPFLQPPYQATAQQSLAASGYAIYAPQQAAPPRTGTVTQQQQPYSLPHAAFPPTIYPILSPTSPTGPPVYPSQPMAVPQPTHTNPKPLFYQRIFGQKRSKSKGSSRKSK